jgi:acyl carrier protein
MTREEVLLGVRECVAASLEMPVESVGRQDRLIDDLGAESLDILDLVFRLEQRFRVSISPRDVERRARQKLGGQPLEVNGVYTEEALIELRGLLPEVPPGELADGLTVAELPRKFRVDTMAGLVWRLAEGKGE